MTLKHISLLLTVVVVLLFIVAISYSSPSKKLRIENSANLAPLHLKRIKTLVGKLKKESLEDSLKLMCTDLDAFGDPGYDHGNGDGFDYKFLKMLSNRRSVKLLQDLHVLQDVERHRILSSVFDKMLGEQQRVIYSMIESPSPAKATREYHTRKHGITWAMFATAEMDRTEELARQVDALEKLRQSILVRCELNGITLEPLVDYALNDPFPDDVAVLNTMLHNLLKRGSFPNALAGLKHRYLPLIKFDAPANTFDMYMQPTDKPRLPDCIERADVWKEISIFKWERELSQPANLEAALRGDERPQFNHRKIRLALVRSLLSGISH